ncbi:MAG: hypothetical protein ACOX1Z_02150 [Candidatus Ratteibacteria bacterium]
MRNGFTASLNKKNSCSSLFSEEKFDRRKKGGGLISLSAKKAGGLKAFLHLKNDYFPVQTKGTGSEDIITLLKQIRKEHSIVCSPSKKICKCIEK